MKTILNALVGLHIVAIILLGGYLIFKPSDNIWFNIVNILIMLLNGYCIYTNRQTYKQL